MALAAIRSRVVDSLAQGIAQAAGPIGPAIALVDSPRAPRDMDCSVLPMIARAVASRGRMIDSALRELLRERGSGVTLSMFPTPPAEYFLRCARSPGCKPHLRAIVDELFGSRGARTRLAPVNGGAIFTRFMLAGFAAFPALEKLGIRAWECFPDLQFRLCANKIPIPPKRSRSEALSVRRTICESVARTIGIRSFEQPRTLDQADAAILALSAAASVAAGQLFEIVCEPEGRFGVPSPVGVPLDNLRSKRVQR